MLGYLGYFCFLLAKKRAENLLGGVKNVYICKIIIKTKIDDNMRTKVLSVVFMAASMFLSAMGNGYSMTANTAEGQDSTLNVIAWFCKGDTMKYVYTTSDFSIENGDTVKKSEKLREEFMIVVTDSTKSGYTLEYSTLDIKTDTAGADDIGRGLVNTMSDYFKNQKVCFTTDEYGVITGITNWREIRDRIKGGVKIMLDSLYRTKELDSVMPRARFEALLNLKYSTEQGVMSGYEELQTLFSLHGKAFTLGRTDIDESEKDSSYTVVLCGYKPYDDYGFEGDYNISAMSTQKFSIDETLSLVGGALGLLMTDSIGEMTTKVLKDSVKEGATATVLEDYYIFYNGWPCMMKNQKIVDFCGRSKVTTRTLVWTYRSWREFEAKEPEASHLSL